MTFERPELLALAPLLVLVLSLAVTAQWRRTQRLVAAYGGGAAAERLAGRDLERFPTSRLAALLLAGVATTVAAAGPDGQAEELSTSQRPIDLVVAIDLSLSMSAEDLGTSRAAHARDVMERIAEALPEERVAVAVFADWAYTLVPLTDDPNVVRFFTASLSPEVMAARDQGTSLGAVVAHARRTLEARRRPEAEAIILVLSDGEIEGDESSVLDSVVVAASDSVHLWTAGVGTEAGAGIIEPGSDGRPMVGPDGAPVVTRLNSSLLREMADAGGGSYHDVSDERGARALVDELASIAGGSATRLTGSGRAFWLTLLAIPLMLWDALYDSGRRPARSRRDEEESW